MKENYKNVLSSYFKHKIFWYVFERPLTDRICFAGKLKVWKFYDHREVKGQGECQDCADVCSKAEI